MVLVINTIKEEEGEIIVIDIKKEEKRQIKAVKCQKMKGIKSGNWNGRYNYNCFINNDIGNICVAFKKS